MNLITRNSDATVEQISNGYIVTCTGRDDDNNYMTEKVYVDNLAGVSKTLSAYFDLKVD